MLDIDFNALDKVAKMIGAIKREYDALCDKYAKLKGNVLDGGFWDEIDAKDMTEEDYDSFVQVNNAARFIDQFMGTDIRNEDLRFIDKEC